MNPLCKCAHPRDLHIGDGECIRPCGCQEFRLDPRSLLEPEPGESAATGTGDAALWGFSAAAAGSWLVPAR